MNVELLLIVISAFFYIFGYSKPLAVYAGLLCQISYILIRGFTLERLPLVGPHDTLFFLSASVVLFAIPAGLKFKQRQRLTNSVVVLSIFFMGLSMLYRPHNYPLPPVLKTFWFEVHVVLSFFSYALFGIAAVLGILFLKNEEREIDLLQYKTVLTGYLFFSAAMIFGGIWAFYAWGTYWLWTPKEIWTVILWLFYNFYLHARMMRWWAGRPSAILGIIGFVIVMFTYLGVSLLMKSSHSF